MRSLHYPLILTSFGLSVLAQTLTLTIPNGPTIVQVFTTNANGLPSRTTIATLSGSTPPTPIPLPETPQPSSLPPSLSSFPPSLPSPSKTENIDGVRFPTDSPTSSTTPAKAVPIGVVAGVVIAVIIVIVLILTFFFIRRRNQRRRRYGLGAPRMEIDPHTSSPVVDKAYMPDPFITDDQAKGMGFDVSNQATRRIDAKFLAVDYRSSSDSKRNSPFASSTHIPLINESDATSRTMAPSSSVYPGTKSQSSSQYPLDVKSPHRPRVAQASSSSDTLIQQSSHPSTGAPSQEELSRRMRDLLAQMEQHTRAPSPDSGAAMVQLQQQVAILQRENDELRSGGEAPPAYEGNGRF